MRRPNKAIWLCRNALDIPILPLTVSTMHIPHKSSFQWPHRHRNPHYARIRQSSNLILVDAIFSVQSSWPNGSFRTLSAHVVPSLIKKPLTMHEACK